MTRPRSSDLRRRPLSFDYLPPSRSQRLDGLANPPAGTAPQEILEEPRNAEPADDFDDCVPKRDIYVTVDDGAEICPPATSEHETYKKTTVIEWSNK